MEKWQIKKRKTKNNRRINGFTNVTGSKERTAHRRLGVIPVSDNSSELRPRPREGQQRFSVPTAQAFGDSEEERVQTCSSPALAKRAVKEKKPK